MILNQGFDHHGLIIMALTRGFDSLTHLLTGSATVAAIVISQSVAVYAKTGEEVYQIAVPVTVQINSDIGGGTGVIIAQDDNSAAAYVSRGNARYKLKDYQGAISNYNKALEIDPNYAKAYLNRGVARSNLKDYQGAISDYDKALKIDPNYADAYYNRGNARRDLKDYQGAISDYNKALKIDPNYADAYVNRGSALYMVGDKRKARGDWETAAQLYRQQGNEDDYKNVMDNIRNFTFD